MGKVVAAAAAIPGAAMATMGNATAAAGAALTAFHVVQYAAVGVGAGATVAKVGAVACLGCPSQPCTRPWPLRAWLPLRAEAAYARLVKVFAASS